MGVAIERETLAREALEAETLRRSDTVKTAVIQAVSHDLRTPLATIEQALDGLEGRELELTEADRAGLLETIRAEHLRLKRLVENLLDLSRLGALPPCRAARAVDGRGARRTGTRRVGRHRSGRGDNSERAAGRPRRRRPDPTGTRERPRERTACLTSW